jgi:Spy/CpxP family protein refolding chaperone
MRRLSAALSLAALLALPAVASAQATDLAVTRQQIETDRQGIVAENLPLTETQATAFWPLYQEYRAAVKKINDQRQTLLFNPTTADSVTDKEIITFLQSWTKLDQDYAKLKGDYAKKFEPVLGARGTLRFYQIENRLDLIVLAGMASTIPLVPVK